MSIFIDKNRNKMYIKIEIWLILLSNFGFTKSGGQSLTNTDNHITRLEKPKLDDNIKHFIIQIIQEILLRMQTMDINSP